MLQAARATGSPGLRGASPRTGLSKEPGLWTAGFQAEGQRGQGLRHVFLDRGGPQSRGSSGRPGWRDGGKPASFPGAARSPCWVTPHPEFPAAQTLHTARP